MIKTFFYCLLASLLIGIPTAFFTKAKWEIYLDKNPPTLVVTNPESRIGIGAAGGKFSVELSDLQPGLDEVVVRLRQLRSDRELYRKKLKGISQTKLEIKISGDEGLVSEGPGEIEVVAFDRSFYSNKSSLIAKAFVDTRPPKVEVLSPQHNLRQGGTQLVFYSAKDENLAFSGVKVGELLFQGFPASQLDSSFSKEGLFAALYTVPLDFKIKPEDIKVKVVDIGGNQAEQGFYNRIARRQFRLISPSNARLLSWLNEFPNSIKNSAQSEVQAGVASHDKKHAAIDAATLVQAFDRVPGTALLAYADKINLSQKIGLDTGNAFIFTGISEARALHSGEVKSVVELASNLFEVELDHGLGLTSFYRGIKNSAVEQGQQVKSGDLLGSTDSYLQVGAAVSGLPVDLTEWWSQDWISAHIFEKIQDVKKILGLVVE